MVKVIVGTNTTKETAIVDSDRTLRSVLDEKGIDYARGSLTLDGCTLKPGDIDKTFDQMNIKEKCYLLSVVKADNA